MSGRIFRIVVPIAIVFVGAVGAALLVAARKTPERAERAQLGPLVEVLGVSRGAIAVEVRAHGEVRAERSVSVVPQVAGQVVEVHSSLVAGGFFKAGEALIVIEPRDYELAINRAEAAVARAEVTLEQQQAEAEVARSEWRALNPGRTPSSDLVFREPQIRQAEAELESARADLQVARLNLERTRVMVPFDGVVVSKQVDLGQFVTVGSPVATVYGTDQVEVRVPLESRELAWFRVPVNGRGDGAEAEVRASFAGEAHVWQGKVDRMEAQLDPNSRMVIVVIRVEDPYAVADGRPPLLPGTFADVVIRGNEAEEVVSIPRHALHEDDTVWVVAEGRLVVRPVDVARADRTTVLVRGGLEDGEQIVVSALDAVTDGMVVRPVAAESAAEAGGAA